MENRSKWSKMTDSNLKAMGKGERTSKKVSTIRKADGTSFRRKNANQYGAAEGGNDYTEKRVNRTDRFGTGGTADSAENGGANIGGTLGSSMYGRGGHVSKGEMVWKKLSSSDKMNFLIKNFKTQITDRSKEDVVNKTYNFLPKIVKIKLESEYANVEDYANGGGTGVSSQTGFAEGTNADLLMNQDYLAYKKGGGVGDEKPLSYYKYSTPRVNMAWNGKIQQGGFYSAEEAMEAIKKQAQTKEELTHYSIVTPDKVIHLGKEYAIRYANGGGLADVPESFPETDAMSYKKGGGVGTIKERVIDYYINNSDNEDLINLMGVSDVPNLKQVAEKWVNNRDSYYDKIFSAIDGIHNRTWAENKFEELGLEKLANGGSTKGFEYSIGGL